MSRGARPSGRGTKPSPRRPSLASPRRRDRGLAITDVSSSCPAAIHGDTVSRTVLEFLTEQPQRRPEVRVMFEQVGLEASG